jgi:outer membrane lipoprotein-sorting protein
MPTELPTQYPSPVGTVPQYVPPVPSKSETPTLRPIATVTSPPTTTSTVVSTATIPPTVTALVAAATRRPTATTYIFSSVPTGADAPAEAIVEKWKAALRNIQSLKGTQEIMAIHADGTLEPGTGHPYANVHTTEETWVLRPKAFDFMFARFHFKAFTDQGSFLSVFDGHGDYLWRSIAPDEVYRPLPENKDISDLYEVTLFEESFVPSLKPESSTVYSLVGTSTINGHSVIELHAHKIDRKENADLDHMFLDANTYLPYRFVVDPTKDQLGIQRTISSLTINGPVLDSDFMDEIPEATTIATIFTPNDNTGPLTVYHSFHDADLSSNFNMFQPSSGINSNIFTFALVQRNGTKEPIYTFNVTVGNDNVRVLEGSYLPQTNLKHTSRDSNILDTVGDPITVGGLAGVLVSNSQYVHIRFQRDGTWIQVEARTKHNALKIAESLQPVK